MLLSCGLGHKRISAVASHNYSISSRLRVHPLGNAPCIPPHKPSPYTPIIHHSPCLTGIQTSILQAVFHGINPPLPWSTHWSTTNTLSNIYPLSNSVVLHCFHMADRKTPSSILLSLHNSLICAFWTLSILLISSKPLRLSICMALILELSFSFHIIVLLSYIRTGMSNDSCKILAPSTFLLHSVSSIPDSSKIYSKYLNSDTCSNHIQSTQTSHSNPSSPPTT